MFRCAGAQALCWVVLLSAVYGKASLAITAERAVPAAENDWGPWVEADSPFFSSVLDARHAGPMSPADNLTPRGIVLNLGGENWACFDLDLLRLAAVWKGSGVTPESMASISYHEPTAKSRVGQRHLPKPAGEVWMANGIYAGWSLSEETILSDPRSPAPTSAEVGRGPLPEHLGRFKAIRLTTSGVWLEYTLGTTWVKEQVSVLAGKQGEGIERRFRLGATGRDLWLVLGMRPGRSYPDFEMAIKDDQTSRIRIEDRRSSWVVRVPASEQEREFSVEIKRSGSKPPMTSEEASATPEAPVSGSEFARPRWSQELVTAAVLSSNHAAYVVDRIALPLSNPWRRNLRLADIQFFSDGRAAAVTFDGDVWILEGLHGSLDTIRWKRFAGGMHEPLGLAIRNDEVFVFDRNGIWRLVDSNGDGEADSHEMFSNVVPQTAESREFANGIRLAPGGEFIIAKGGQQESTLGKANGTVQRISADGRQSTVLGWGFRQPFIGVHPETGLVTASDQQGNYVPSTPLYLVHGGAYYGYLSSLLPKETYPARIEDPITWIPHEVNPSGATQIWLVGARMGSLNGALIHLAYNRPELFVVRLNERGPRLQGAVVSLTRDLDFSPLSGAVNPVDGQLYLAGFRIYDTSAADVSGLARVRFTGGQSLIPREILPMKEGVFLRFDGEVDGKLAAAPERYSVRRWNYRRTAAYGSGHYKLDGTDGQERLWPSSAYLSRDRKGIFIGIPDMRPGVMQMVLTWDLALSDGTPLKGQASFSPFTLPSFQASVEGFGDLTIDLEPRLPVNESEPSPSLEEGKRVYLEYGCVACHSLDRRAGSGPSWLGLYRRSVKLTTGESVLADESYLRESILDPAAKVAEGFQASMPSYSGVLKVYQVDSVIEFIRSLGQETTSPGDRSLE